MQYEENENKLDKREINADNKIEISSQERKLLLGYRALSDENKLTMDILCKRLLEHEERREKID